jgi:hypothetical protein
MRRVISREAAEMLCPAGHYVMFFDDGSRYHPPTAWAIMSPEERMHACSGWRTWCRVERQSGR